MKILKVAIKVEPYWNVNFLYSLDNGCYYVIKVEPYWNVNFNFGGYEGYKYFY